MLNLPELDINIKYCNGCERFKQLTEFSPNKSMRLGVQTCCKECINKRKSEKYKKDSEYRNKQIKASDKFRKNNPNKIKSTQLKHWYGITLEQYNKILTEQDNKCAICRTPNNQIKSLHVDHEHKTGKIRGILCTKCNMGIGYFDDSIELLTKAIEYLNAKK